MTLMEDCDAVRRRSGEPKHRRKATVKFRDKSGNTWGAGEHSLGRRFGSNTDTEVIVAAYAQWGPDCQLRFNGMWGLAIWDNQDRQLFLSRDRFGVKPLHYTLHNGAIAFASELKAFLGDAPDFVEVGEAGIAMDDAMRRQRRVQLVG